jgi:hypothetical protein
MEIQIKLDQSEIIEILYSGIIKIQDEFPSIEIVEIIPYEDDSFLMILRGHEDDIREYKSYIDNCENENERICRILLNDYEI